MRGLLCFLPAVALTSCVAVAAAAIGAAAIGAYSYANNELSRDYHATYDQAWDATLKAAKDLNLTVTSQNKDYQKAVVQAKRADGTPVTINLEALEKDRVKLTVRVGTFESDENRRAAEAIHDQILRNMGGKPAEPEPKT
jgi:hypothetical protein